MRILLLLLCLHGLALVGIAQETENRIREIEVTPHPIFTEQQAADHLLYRLINWSHWTSRKQTVLNEIWLKPGDAVDEEGLREIERELRRTDLFARAEAKAIPTGTPGEVDLDIDTADNFTLRLAVLSSFAGDVGSYGLLLGDRNLFGSGDDLRLQAEVNDEDEEILSASYLDRHLFGTAAQMRLNIGRTEEGHFYSGSIGKPLRHLEDPWAWNVSAGSSESAIDFFEGGESVAEIPRESTSFGGSITRAFGPRNARQRLGLRLGYNDSSYGETTGENADEYARPADATSISITPNWGLRRVNRREAVRDLDTIDFTQDIEFGWFPSLSIGAVYRDVEGSEEELQANLGVGLATANQLGPETYLTTSSGGAWRGTDTRDAGWFVNSAVHGYHRVHPRHLLAGSVTYDASFESDGIAAQLTLGEDNGLRGYPARQFSGTRRVRINLEDRIRTDLEWRSFHLGVVGLLDAGTIRGEGLAPDDWLASAGVGLRIASSEWYGGDVLRLDLAYPLVAVDGMEEKPLFSIALGQVFGFFGNSSTLPPR